MLDLVLTDDKVDNYFFKDFFENKNYKKIGITLSSGTDSALVLFFLCKFITETENFDKIIFPWFGRELNNELSRGEQKVKQIIEVIKNLYPKVKIENIHIDEWMRIPATEEKNKYSIPLMRKFQADNNLDIVLSGSTCNPPKEIMEEYQMETKFCTASPARNEENISNPEYWGHTNPEEFPWRFVNKKFIAHQYRKYNLMDNLYPLTESCVIETAETLLFMESWSHPCKKCFWCREKYWAFGSYDGGIQ